MWKAFSRSVCDVVERRVGFTVFRSDVSNSNTRSGPAKRRKIPCHGPISSIIPQLKTYCPLKHLKAAKHGVTSHDHHGEREHRHKTHAKWREPPITACLGAVAMGWVIIRIYGILIQNNFSSINFLLIYWNLTFFPEHCVGFGMVLEQTTWPTYFW